MNKHDPPAACPSACSGAVQAEHLQATCSVSDLTEQTRDFRDLCVFRGVEVAGCR